MFGNDVYAAFRDLVYVPNSKSNTVTEIDPPQSEAVAQMLRDAGLSQVRVERDLAGLDRHVLGKGR